MFETYITSSTQINHQLNCIFYQDQVEKITLLDLGEYLHDVDSKINIYKNDLELEELQKSKIIFTLEEKLKIYLDFLIDSYITMLEEPFLHSDNLDFELEKIKRIKSLLKVIV